MDVGVVEIAAHIIIFAENIHDKQSVRCAADMNQHPFLCHDHLFYIKKVAGTIFQGKKRCQAPFFYMGEKGAWHLF